VNDAPTLGDLNLAAVEDTALPMNLLAAAADIDITNDLAVVVGQPSQMASSSISTTLTAAIVAGPLHGAVVFNPDGTFTYTAAANYNGADITSDLAGVVGQPSRMASSSISFTYRVNDGHSASDNGDSNIATVTLSVASVNDAPQGASNTVATKEDTPYVFQVADFGFTDANDASSNAGANNFAAVTITTLPQAGTLTNNGAAVTAGQSISVADITS
jgi:hypothetical protein